MPFRIQNETIEQQTLNLIGGNAITLMPRGSKDVQGPTDCGILLAGEETCDDVVNRTRTGDISLTELADSAPSVATDVEPKSRARKTGTTKGIDR